MLIEPLKFLLNGSKLFRKRSLFVRILSRIILPATLALAMAAGTFAAEITVKHAQGETVLPDTPKKVLTFDLAALDTLDLLGVDVAGVPDFALPDYLAKYKDTAKIGSLFEPDFEAVAAAEPDLIIVAGRSSKAYPELAKIAPTVDLSTDWADYGASVKANSVILGDIFGKQAEVAKLIADLDASIETVKASAADAGKGLIVLTGGGKVSAYGTGSRFGWIHQTLGVTPAIADVEAATHGDAISFEFIHETNPDWLFVIDRDAAVGEAGQSAEQVLNNELVTQTNAWKNGHVVYIDGMKSYIINGGLHAFQDLVNQVGKALAKKS